jgi:hypothetical protein
MRTFIAGDSADGHLPISFLPTLEYLPPNQSIVFTSTFLPKPERVSSFVSDRIIRDYSSHVHVILAADGSIQAVRPILIDFALLSYTVDTPPIYRGIDGPAERR